MVLNFDVDLFCESLTATKPPYQCPVKSCGKIYKSIGGIQFHMHNFDHSSLSSDDTKPMLPLTVVTSTMSTTGSQSSSHSGEQDVAIFSAGSTQLTDFDIGGQVIQVDIQAPLNVVVQHSETCGHGKCHDAQQVRATKVCSPSIGDCVSRKDGHVAALSPSMRLPEPSFKVLSKYAKCPKVPSLSSGYYKYKPKSAEEIRGCLAYDMDEMDSKWLSIFNEKRRKDGFQPISKEVFEMAMDWFEKESYFQPLVEAEQQLPADDEAMCSICQDGEWHTHNAILFCDLCNLAVHQECYGVPTVPDGPWLCRRCLLSPSRAVRCCLCPSLRGAFKQTDDGRWAHVVCALWIPAVGFANGVFLEPVDGINRIAPARWKLTCYICRRRGVGACIQCHKPSCYAAFHVTCAFQAGLYMKVDRVVDCGLATAPGPNGILAPVFKKSAYCDVHTPFEHLASSTLNSNRDEHASDVRSSASVIAEVRTNLQKKVREARRYLTEKKLHGPVLSVPVVSPESINKIVNKLSYVEDKKTFVDKLHCYWILKRDAFSGVSLISMTSTNIVHFQPRVNKPILLKKSSVANQIAKQNAEQKVVSNVCNQLPKARGTTAVDAVGGQSSVDPVRTLRRLRQQFEKVRLLLELVKKRERIKYEQVRHYEALKKMQLEPLTVLLCRALEEIESSRENGHLSELWRKAKSCQYSSVDEFAADFDLVVASLLEASKFHSVIRKQCLRIQDKGAGVIHTLRNLAKKIGFESDSGLHVQSVDHGPTEPVSDLVKPESPNPTVCQSEETLPCNSATAVVNSPQSGVNRRTMILFSNKTKQRRLSAIQLAAGKDMLENILRMEDDVESPASETTADSCKGESTAERVADDSQQAESEPSMSATATVNGKTLPPPVKRRPRSSADREVSAAVGHHHHTVQDSLPCIADSVAEVGDGTSALNDDDEKKAAVKRKRALDDEDDNEASNLANDLDRSSSRRHASDKQLPPTKRKKHVAAAGVESDVKDIVLRASSSPSSLSPVGADDRSAGEQSVANGTDWRSLPKRRNAVDIARKSTAALHDAAAAAAAAVISDRQKVDKTDEQLLSVVVAESSALSSKRHSGRKDHSGSRAAETTTTLSNDVLKFQTGEISPTSNSNSSSHEPPEVSSNSRLSVQDHVAVGRHRLRKVIAAAQLQQQQRSQCAAAPSGAVVSSEQDAVCHRKGLVSTSSSDAVFVNGKGKSGVIAKMSSRRVNNNNNNSKQPITRCALNHRSRSVPRRSSDRTTGSQEPSVSNDGKIDPENCSSKLTFPNAAIVETGDRYSFRGRVLPLTVAVDDVAGVDFHDDLYANKSVQPVAVVRHRTVSSGLSPSSIATRLSAKSPTATTTSPLPAGNEDGVLFKTVCKEYLQDTNSRAHRTVFRPLDVVWAKCRGFPAYPGMVVDPIKTKCSTGNNGFVVPHPPDKVLELRPKHQHGDMLLIVFFDVKHTWQWMHRSTLEPLGVDEKLDSARLSGPMKASMRKSIHLAYDRATLCKRKSVIKPTETV